MPGDLVGEIISLTAADGHVLDAYGVVPASRPVGGLVVVQEVFGVNRHIREVCDRVRASYGNCSCSAHGFVQAASARA